MALETGTYISDLVVTNPTSSDKKNVGDDHFRLLKAVLKNTLPNALRAFYFPSLGTKSADYTLVGSDENKLFEITTTGGVVILTLPTPTFAGWTVRIMKATPDVNPVYIVPPSGNINGFAKIRLNVPFVVYEFFWDGSTFIRLNAAGGIQPGTLEYHGGATAPVGYAVATGQSLVRLDHPELFLAWGTTYGAVDGTHFNAPNLVDRVPIGAGSTYAIAATGGSATTSLTVGSLPAAPPLNKVVTLDLTGIGANLDYSPLTNITRTGSDQAVGFGASNELPVDLVNFNLITANLNGNLGSGEPLNNLPPYMGLFPIFRLC